MLKEFFNANPTLMLRQIAAVPTLARAWHRVRANRGAAGVDSISIRAFEGEAEQNLTELSRNLLERTYEPLPARYVTILKQNGKERELGILTVRDRIAQRAVLDAIEPLFELQFLDCSFAFRPNRSVDMAVQRIIVARANGYRWTVEADIENFFPSLDRVLLFRETARTMDDADINRLLEAWLDAATAVDDALPHFSLFTRSQRTVKAATRSVRDTAWRIFDDLLCEQIGVTRDAASPLEADDFNVESAALIDDTQDGFVERSVVSHPPTSSARRAAVRRFMMDGFLLAVAERAVLRRVLSAKAFGVGGAALALAVTAPPILRAWRERNNRLIGALQGAPISPLLSNIYMHSFDEKMAETGWRLIRYCDDFVVLCRSEDEAKRAMADITVSISERRLRLHPEKTRIVPPIESFDFLGHRQAGAVQRTIQRRP